MPTADRQLDKEQALGILTHLNKTELQEMLDNEDKIDQMVLDNQQIKALDAEKQTLVASNKSLSEFNLSREPRLSQGKERLSSAHQRAQELYKNVNEKKIRVDSNSTDTSIDEALAMLKTAAESLEEESETLSEQFLDGQLNLDTFLISYIEKRTMAHTRKIKAEKMTEIVRNKPQTQQAPAPQPSQHQWPQMMAMPGAYPPGGVPVPRGPAPPPPRGAMGQPYPYGPPAGPYGPPASGYPPGGYSMQPRPYVPRR